MPKESSRTLPPKDKSIAAASFQGAGRETEYRFEGNPGLVLAVQAPNQAGRSARIWRAYYSLTRDGKRTIRKVRIGVFPAVGLAKARRCAAEIIEAVERGEDPAAEQKARNIAKVRRTLTFADLVEDHLTDIAKRRTAKHVRLAHMYPADVKSTDIQLIVDAVYDRGSEAMARHLLTYLRAIFNNAIKGNPELQAKYGLEVNPADRVGRDGR
jgi:hypothetical protein